MQYGWGYRRGICSIMHGSICRGIWLFLREQIDLLLLSKQLLLLR